MMQLIIYFLIIFSLTLPKDPLPLAKEVWEKRHTLNMASGAPYEVEEIQQKIRKLAGLSPNPVENYLFSYQFLDMIRYSFIYFPSRVSQGKNKLQTNILSSQDVKEMKALSIKMAKAFSGTEITFSEPKPNNDDLLVEEGNWVIKRGLCSAASLLWAKSFLQKIGNELKGKSPEELLLAAAFATTPVKDGENQEMAILQGAMNTISRSSQTVDPLSWSFKHEKAKGLGAFLDLKTTPYGLPFYKSMPTVDQLERVLENMENGVYFYRMIQEKKNEKGEALGHSEILVKGDNILLFYDPNLGVVAFQPEDKAASFIHFFWGLYYRSFFSSARNTTSHFYKLQQN